MWLADRSAVSVPPAWKRAERMKKILEMMDFGAMMALSLCLSRTVGDVYLGLQEWKRYDTVYVNDKW